MKHLLFIAGIVGIIILLYVATKFDNLPSSLTCKLCKLKVSSKHDHCLPYVQCGDCQTQILISHRCNGIDRQHMFFPTNVNVVTNR